MEHNAYCLNDDINRLMSNDIMASEDRAEIAKRVTEYIKYLRVSEAEYFLASFVFYALC